MARFKIPTCVGILSNGSTCNHPMSYTGERDPRAYGPGWKPGVHVFQCGYCGAIRSLDVGREERYVERT